MDHEQSIIEKGAVGISGTDIIDVGSHEELLSLYEAKKYIDARGGIIMPGLINAHTHAGMSLFRGLADDLPLLTWLNEYIFTAERKLTFDMVFKGTLLACAEMILSGTTTFCDMYLFEDAVAQAAKKSGMRAIVGEVIYDFPSPNYGPLEKGFAYTEVLIKKWQDDPLITIAVEPHSPYLCSPELLIRAHDLAERFGSLLIIHLSETDKEVRQIKERYGLTPVGHLGDLGVLGPNLVAVHCVALTDNDIDLLKQFNVKVAHNPESNMKLASGIAPLPELLKRGVTVGLGTDGCASNNNLDLFQEMDTAAKLHKVNTLDPTVVDAETVVRMATIDAARVLGLEDTIGSIKPGKKGDIIVIDIIRPHLVPLYNPYSHLVYSVTGSDVVTSVINGRVVMEDRVLTTLDLEKVMSDVNKIAKEIKRS
nr:amidohydrolase [Desulfobacterales bacterium]